MVFLLSITSESYYPDLGYMNMLLSTLIRKSSLNIQGVPVSLEILIVNFEIDDHSVKLGLLYQNRLISDANLLHSWLVECPIARVFEFVEQLHRCLLSKAPSTPERFRSKTHQFFSDAVLPSCIHNSTPGNAYL